MSFSELHKAKVGPLFRSIVDMVDFPSQAYSKYFFIYCHFPRTELPEMYLEISIS